MSTRKTEKRKTIKLNVFKSVSFLENKNGEIEKNTERKQTGAVPQKELPSDTWH